MSEYVIYTDSGCDIAPEILKQWDVKALSLTFRFAEEEKEYANGDMPEKEFYDAMRAGRVIKTAAVNAESFKDAFAEELKQGKDVLYLGFSSGLSTTCNSARIAANELAEEYSDQKVVVVDTLAASAGQGMIVYLATEEKKKGKTLEEVAEYVKGIIPQLCHWFTVDDLQYLKRGGRISPTVAFAGTLLGIKPVLHVDDEGHLVSVSKVRGRKSAMKAIVDQYGELALDPKNGVVFACHGDCLEDVELLESMLKETYGIGIQLITYVGPVIGAHSGPGTFALFFLGKNR